MDRIGQTTFLRPAISPSVFQRPVFQRPSTAIGAVLAALVLCAAARVDLPAHPPIPDPRPQPHAPAAGKADATTPAATAMPAQETPVQGMPPQELACRTHLRELGVAFEERERLAEPAAGCLVEYPVAITSLGTGISLAPEAVLNCTMAEAAARFAAGTISPAAERAFGSPLAAVAQASAYVCRTRHGQSKISEHALGNALDMSAFTLKDGTRVEVKAYGAADTARTDFIRTLRAQACGPFKTVLGPGSDADHALHLHLDLQKRRHGGTFCQ